MALTTVVSYNTKVANPVGVPFIKTTNAVGTASYPYSLWVNAANAGAVPTTAAVPTQALAGGMPEVPTATAGKLYISAITINSEEDGTYILCDRLSHQGGLSGTAVGEQTTNLPTAALTRYTDGVGVQAAVDITTAVGVTARTFTLNYTNTAAAAGRTSIAADIGGTTFREANRFIPAPLAASDVGLLSIEGLTLSASTGTAGVFGLTLYKPLLAVHVAGRNRKPVRYDAFRSGFEMIEIYPGACLFFQQLTMGTDYPVGGDISGMIEIINVV